MASSKGFRKFLTKSKSNFKPKNSLSQTPFFRGWGASFWRVLHFFSYFAIELFLLSILFIVLVANLWLRGQEDQKAKPFGGSVFFVYLKNHPELNKKLVESFESFEQQASQNPSSERQILSAATAAYKPQAGKTSASPLPTLSGSTLLKPNPAGSLASAFPKKDVEVYQVRGGDTVARIAKAYGVSVETIIWENNLSVAGFIKPGQELKILPTTGVKHLIKESETISQIAKKYGVDAEDILEYNEIEIEDHILAGEEIIIPNGIKKSPPSPARQKYLAELKREDFKEFKVPDDYKSGGASGFIWPLPSAYRVSQYYSRRHKAIDIPCRDCQIVATADGLVELSGWQRGYGYTIVINHGQGLKTRYAHGKEVLVSAGQNITQGQPIMISGSTGRSTGPHLHFEIKRNGELLNPLGELSR